MRFWRLRRLVPKTFLAQRNVSSFRYAMPLALCAATAVATSSFSLAEEDVSKGKVEDISNGTETNLVEDDDFEEERCEVLSNQIDSYGVFSANAANLDALAMDPTRDVLVLKFSDHCPACICLVHITRQICKALESTGIRSLRIVHYNSDNNFSQSTQSFTKDEKLANPIIKLFPAKSTSSSSSTPVTGSEGESNAEELPAIDETTDPPSHTLTMKMGTASKIMKYIHGVAQPFDVEAVQNSLNESNEATIDDMLKGLQTIFKMECASKARDVKKGKGKFMPMCSTFNPCASIEVNEVTLFMAMPALEGEFQAKFDRLKKMHAQLNECKKGQPYKHYLDQLKTFAGEELEFVASLESLEKDEDAK